ncbi:hypothetical protein DJ523_00115 [Sulfolobus sp. E5]|nr:hypothetical protein DJ523_00115 [Sulfolobus sp. E5]
MSLIHKEFAIFLVKNKRKRTVDVNKLETLHIFMLIINERLPEKAVLVEEPEVAELLSNYLKVHRSIKRRGYIIFMGEYNGNNLVISTHGVGGPSTALILEELIANGVRIILRYGTAGGLQEEEKLGKYIIPLGVSHHYKSSLYQSFRNDVVLSLFPDLELAYSLYKFLKEKGREVFYGSVFQSDDFYNESHLNYDDAVDMETGTLFLISRLKGVRSISLLIIANYKGKWINYEEIYRRDANLILSFIANN